MSDNENSDKTLRERIRSNLSLQSDDATDEGEDADAETEQEADSEETNPDDETEQEADEDAGSEDSDATEQEAGDVVDLLVSNTDMDEEEAMALAEKLGDAGSDSGEDDEDGGETADAEGELSAEAAADVADAAADAVDQELDERLDGVVTEEDLKEHMESFADTVGEEMASTVEQALAGDTPTPGSDSGTDITKEDLVGGLAGGNGGD